MTPLHHQSVVNFVRGLYRENNVLLHRPVFEGNEKTYLADCIDSNYVSSVGARVTEFEQKIAAFTGSKYAVATVNGTAALHIALELAGVRRGDEVISQALTFIATCNAVSYIGAVPVFVDVSRTTLGMSADALRRFLHEHVKMQDGYAVNTTSGRRVAACVPMHTFGHPCEIEQIVSLCAEYGIALVEDAAESLGSYVGKRHTGTFGVVGTFSFNGNKIITTGGGGMIVTDDLKLAQRAKHITTTAKVPHPFEFVHDEVGYNYRLPNLNAALGCAQMEQLDRFLKLKRILAKKYMAYFESTQWRFFTEPEGCKSNYWLNALVMDSLAQRNAFLQQTNDLGVMTRPVWRLMNSLEMFKYCQHDGLENSLWLEERVVNIPSSVPSGIAGLALEGL